MRKIFILALALLVVLGGLTWLVAGPFQRRPVQTAQPPAAMQTGTPTIAAPTITPTIIAMGTSTTVTVVVQIMDVRLIPESVNLLRVNATGNPIVIGVMRDDGLNGDSVAGDKVFSLRQSFNEPAAGQFQLQVSAAFKGALRRPLSPQGIIDVWKPFSTPSSTLQLLVPPALNPSTRTSSHGTIETILAKSAAPSPDLAIALSIEVFEAASSSTSIQDIISQRLHPASIFSVTPHLGGVLVVADTLVPAHFFHYTLTTKRALHAYGASQDYFLSEEFSKFLSAARY